MAAELWLLHQQEKGGEELAAEQQSKHSSGVEEEVDAGMRRISGWNKWV